MQHDLLQKCIFCFFTLFLAQGLSSYCLLLLDFISTASKFQGSRVAVRTGSCVRSQRDFRPSHVQRRQSLVNLSPTLLEGRPCASRRSSWETEIGKRLSRVTSFLAITRGCNPVHGSRVDPLINDSRSIEIPLSSYSFNDFYYEKRSMY